VKDVADIMINFETNAMDEAVTGEEIVVREKI
jgi:hypothetical protein